MCLGGGALIPSPKAVGLECVPPSPPIRLGNLKRAPVPRLLPRWAYVIGLGVNEKVQNTGEQMPSVFLGVDFIVF